MTILNLALVSTRMEMYYTIDHIGIEKKEDNSTEY